VETSNYRHAVGICYLIPQPWFIDGVEGITGDLARRFFNRMQDESGLFTGGIERRIRVACGMDQPPVDLHEISL
jgi:hypothetical protein